MHSLMVPAGGRLTINSTYHTIKTMQCSINNGIYFRPYSINLMLQGKLQGRFRDVDVVMETCSSDSTTSSLSWCMAPNRIRMLGKHLLGLAQATSPGNQEHSFLTFSFLTRPSCLTKERYTLKRIQLPPIFVELPMLLSCVSPGLHTTSFCCTSMMSLSMTMQWTTSARVTSYHTTTQKVLWAKCLEHFCSTFHFLIGTTLIGTIRDGYLPISCFSSCRPKQLITTNNSTSGGSLYLITCSMPLCTPIPHFNTISACLPRHGSMLPSSRSVNTGLCAMLSRTGSS